MRRQDDSIHPESTPLVVPSTTKLSITARLDMDNVSWLKKEADKKGLPYQTLMNSILKEVMHGTLLSEQTLRKVIREELAKAG